MRGSGLRAGVGYGCNVVGYEWDRVFNNGASPPGLRVLEISPTVSQEATLARVNRPTISPAQARFVFASGSIYFSYALDSLHIWDIIHMPAYDPCLMTSRSAAIPGLQVLMAHVMRELLINHHPLPHDRVA